MLGCQRRCPQRWCWNQSWQWAGHAAPSGLVWGCAVTAGPNVVFGMLCGLLKSTVRNVLPLKCVCVCVCVCVWSVTLRNVICASSCFFSCVCFFHHDTETPRIWCVIYYIYCGDATFYFLSFWVMDTDSDTSAQRIQVLIRYRVSLNLYKSLRGGQGTLWR